MKPFQEISEVPFAKHWLMGHTSAFASSTLGFVETCQQKGLDMGRARIAFRDFLFLFHPDLAKEVLQGKHKHYHKSFAYNGLKAFLGQGLLTSEGDFWLQQRRTMQPGFYRTTLVSLRETMRSKANYYAEHLALHPDFAPTLQGFFLYLTREITSDCLFGPRLLDLEQAIELDEALADLRAYANARLKNPFHPPAWVPTPLNRRFKQAIQLLKALLAPIIAQKQAGDSDLLGMLMGLKDPESGSGMALDQLYYEVVTLFVAGQETTSNALAFALKLLSDHPDALEKMEQEALDESASEYPWTDAVIKEVLRFYPPVWAMSREAMQDTEISGHHVPKGTTVFLSIYALQRHPEFWEAPDEFRPERWLEKGKGLPNAYFPFSAGPRKCIGDQFALMEMREVLLALVRKLRWTFPKGQSYDLITPMTLNFKHPIRIQWHTKSP